MRVAVVTDALTVYGGAERVLVEILNLYPQARLFALADFTRENKATFLGDRKVITSFIQKLPFAARHFRNYLQVWPLAVEQLDLSGFDVVISSQHAVAHGVITDPDQVHVVYTHSPMRYAWDLRNQYVNESTTGAAKRWYVRGAMHRLRTWDFAAAQRVDRFAANSSFVADRIRKFYRRDAEVIYPPVDTDNFTLASVKEDYFVTASRLVPYKRVDLIVEAFNRMPDKRLIVIGDGPERARLQALAGPNVTVAGYVGSAQLRRIVASASAFVFAAVEDFGIAPVEAQAAGTPVICLGRGGLLETVRGLDSDAPTGVFFEDQNVESLRAAVQEFDRARDAIRTENCRMNALRFDARVFRSSFSAFVEKSFEESRAADVGLSRRMDSSAGNAVLSGDQADGQPADSAIPLHLPVGRLT